MRRLISLYTLAAFAISTSARPLGVGAPEVPIPGTHGLLPIALPSGLTVASPDSLMSNGVSVNELLSQVSSSPFHSGIPTTATAAPATAAPAVAESAPSPEPFTKRDGDVIPPNLSSATVVASSLGQVASSVVGMTGKGATGFSASADGGPLGSFKTAGSNDVASGMDSKGNMAIASKNAMMATGNIANLIQTDAKGANQVTSAVNPTTGDMNASTGFSAAGNGGVPNVVMAGTAVNGAAESRMNSKDGASAAIAGDGSATGQAVGLGKWSGSAWSSFDTVNGFAGGSGPMPGSNPAGDTTNESPVSLINKALKHASNTVPKVDTEQVAANPVPRALPVLLPRGSTFGSFTPSPPPTAAAAGLESNNMNPLASMGNPLSVLQPTGLGSSDNTVMQTLSTAFDPTLTGTTIPTSPLAGMNGPNVMAAPNIFPVPDWATLTSSGNPHGITIFNSAKTALLPIHLSNTMQIKFQVDRRYIDTTPAYFIVLYAHGKPQRVLDIVDPRDLDHNGAVIREVVMNMEPSMAAFIEVVELVVIAPVCKIDELHRPWEKFVWDYTPTVHVSIGIN
ncbi:hypothetical protein GQ42DRAFT_170560 [Ramicandelaber brevisporus]|nr:hypothetical protein GQ42DRAFT_170560 [Ramicandelaber brevisporus]